MLHSTICHHHLRRPDTYLYLQVHLQNSFLFGFWLVAELAGDWTPAATLPSEAENSRRICFPVVDTQFPVLVPCSMGVGIKMSIASFRQSPPPHPPAHTTSCAVILILVSLPLNCVLLGAKICKFGDFVLFFLIWVPLGSANRLSKQIPVNCSIINYCIIAAPETTSF